MFFGKEMSLGNNRKRSGELGCLAQRQLFLKWGAVGIVFCQIEIILKDSTAFIYVTKSV